MVATLRSLTNQFVSDRILNDVFSIIPFLAGIQKSCSKGFVSFARPILTLRIVTNSSAPHQVVIVMTVVPVELWIEMVYFHAGEPRKYRVPERVRTTFLKIASQWTHRLLPIVRLC
jgi:hypothetical protein